MRKLSGVVAFVGAVIAPVCLAQASTEVARYPANNTFVTAVSNDDVTGISTGVFVSREIGQSGGPIDRIGVIISQGSNLIFFGGGTLPSGAFHVNAKSASVSVDLHNITLDFQSGDVPANGVVTANWAATDVQHDAGNSKYTFGNVQILFVGTGTDATAAITGSVFGTPLAAPFGSLRFVREAYIVITHD